MDLDAEFARFTAELKSVEAAAAAEAPAPLAPHPARPPPQAQNANQSGGAAAAASTMAPPPLAPPPLQPPPLQPPPVLPPPPLRPPPPVAAGLPAGQGFVQQPYGVQQMGAPPAPLAGGVMGMQQPFYGQQQQQQPTPQQQQQQQMGSWAEPAGAGSMPGAAGSLPPPLLNPGAPADAETLKRLKEELLQQKQQTAPGRFAAAAAATGAAGGGAAGGSSSGTASKKVVVREAAGQRWVDTTLAEWPENDFRIFVGDLGNEVNDEALSKAFSRYPSFAKAKVIRDKKTKKSKGFGIVSLLDGGDFAKALKEMNGKYIGNRPCKLSKSTWKERAAPVGKGFGGASGAGGNKRKDNPAAAAANGERAKVHKPGPRAKYHVPIMRQK